MILTKEIEIKITKSNISHYLNLGYKCELKDVILISVPDVTKGSKKLILVKCEVCGVEKNLSIYNYWNNYKTCEFYACTKCSHKKSEITNMIKYGVKYPSELEEYKLKIKNIMILKYGVDNPMKINIFKDKMKETCMLNHGVDNPSKSSSILDKVRRTKIKIGLQCGNISDYNVYKNRVYYLTNKIRESIFENWDGYDYYDGEYIRDNFNLEYTDSMYPTIDHKISILYGYLNDITPEEICKIGNLCITKRSINSSKGESCDKEFKKLL